MFCFIWRVIFLLRFESLESNYVFVIKFACAILILKTSVVNLLNSGVVIYLSWLWLLTLFSISLISLVLKSALLNKLLTSGILFSAVVNAVFVAKLLISGILPSISAILV